MAVPVLIRMLPGRLATGPGWVLAHLAWACPNLCFQLVLDIHMV
jgi:hypothetical protein